MSKKGINKFAEILTKLQLTRSELLSSATTQKPIDKVDLELAQLLELAGDTVKTRFTELTLK